jgi:DNA polymerase I-like protein with 3'-5' exonuclease and polymerase domains
MEYASYTSLKNVITKDLKDLRKGRRLPIHSSFRSLVATGRTSSSGPNIQNVRRLPGIRECFVPRSGKVFLDADYDGLELRTLAQVCLNLLGKSRLAEVLNSGIDPHLVIAAQILKIPYGQAVELRKKKDQKLDDARQTGKVANFGISGGLGAESLVVFAKKNYGVIMTEEDAKELKALWLKAFPEMVQYFEMINRHSREDREEGLVNVEHCYTKRLRGAVKYTVACNSYFQGLGADATKYAGFLIARECYAVPSSPLYGCRIVNYVHDQFLLECDEDRAHDAAQRLREVMIEGVKGFVPDVPAKVSELIVARCWSKEAKPVFDENNRLIPWDKEFHVEHKKVVLA